MKDKIRKIIKSRIFTLFGILLFIAVCMAAGSLIAFVQHESDPAEQAVAYFRAFVQQDYDKMYSCLKIEDGSYIDKSMYTAEIKKIRENMVIDSYDIQETEKKDGMKQVTIRCTDNETKESQDFVVKFTEKRNGFQIIPDYYINMDDMMVKNFSVVLPKNNKLELNGTEITDKSADISSDEKGNLVYSIKGILKGQYKIAATNQYYAVIQNANMTKNDTKIDLTGEDYIANDKYTKLVSESGENVIEQFYKAVRDRKPSYKKLLSCFDNNKKLIAKVEQAVSDSQEIVYWPDRKNIDSYKVIEMKMSKLKSSDIKYNPGKKTYEITYSYSYEYVSSTDTALYTSYVYHLSGTCKSTMKLTYMLNGDDIVLTNIKVTNKNKKDGE